MGIEILKEVDIAFPFRVRKGDTVTLTYTDRFGRKFEAIEHKISGEEMTLNKAVIFKASDEFGCSEGIGGFFGKGKE